MGQTFVHQWSKTNSDSIWNDSNNDDLDVFLTFCHWWSIMVVSSLWSWKQTAVKKRLMWKDDRRPRKVLWNEWSRFSSWRSELIESIALESRVSINARTVCLGSLMLLDRDKRRQESLCWFCMMTMEDPIGLEWRPNIWLKIGSNPMKIVHIRQIWVHGTCFYSRKWKIICDELNLTRTNKCCHRCRIELSVSLMRTVSMIGFLECKSALIEVERSLRKINWHCYRNIFCKDWRKNFPSVPCINDER